MKQFQAEIISQNKISENYIRLIFTWDKEARIPKPGQFFTIRISGTNISDSVPLLRRPFAFSGFNPLDNQAEFIYMKRGIGTEILSSMSDGGKFDVIAPLGNYLKIPKEKKNMILVSGGIGLGPILFYSDELDTANIPHQFIFGTRTRQMVPEFDSRKKTRPVICTDDGSMGYKGTVRDYFDSLPDESFADAEIAACGPYPMLLACHEFAQKRKLVCRVVMEQTMACAIGACMGCAIKTTRATGFSRVCVEGPVFDSREIVWT